MTSSAPSSTRKRAAQRQVAAFTQRFGNAALYLSYHAAFPLSLTPELLYRLWANFQTDQTGVALNIPWIAVSDLLLSGLCREVGYELYEMDAAVRIELLKQLQNEPLFGQQRIQQLAEFVLSYVQHQLNSPDPDLREVARTQRWTALAYIRPGTATRELIVALASLHLSESAEWLRLTSLVETLADPLTEFKPLLCYASGMKSFIQGDIEGAIAQLFTLVEAGRIHLGGVELPVPEQIQRDFVASEREPYQTVQTQGLVAIAATQNVNPPSTPHAQDIHAPIIRLRLQLTPNDLIKAQYFHIRTTLPLWVKLAGIFFVFLFATFLYLQISHFFKSGDFIGLLGSLLPGFFLLSFYSGIGIFIDRRIRRNSKFKVMLITSDNNISPETIESISEISMSRFQMSDFYMYRVNSNFILVYLSSIQYMIFPRRCFNSEKDFQQFIVYLKATFNKPGKPTNRKTFSPRSLPYKAFASYESTISFRIQLTSEDYLKANYLHVRPARRWIPLYFTLLGTYLGIIIFTGYSAAILGIVVFWWYFFLIPFNVRRLSSQMVYITFEHQVEISPEILEILSVTGTIRMYLADFHKYKISKKLIILYLTDRSFYIFPRRCFPSEADVQTFLSYLQANLGSPKS
jgi:YcxB-like protein